MNKTSLGKRMRQRRLSLGVTQDAIAREASISPTFYSRIESGKVSPSLHTFISITNALQTTTDFLLQDILQAPSLHAQEPLVSLEHLLDSYVRLRMQQGTASTSSREMPPHGPPTPCDEPSDPMPPTREDLSA